MPNDKEQKEPFLFQLVQQCLDADEDQSPNSDGLTDKELYSTFAFIIVDAAILILTIGPFSLLR